VRTTLLNPTVWLLAATAIAALAGAARQRSARESIERVCRYASAWPVLVALLTMAGGGLASRAVLGYLSPGAYTEEVVAARTFLNARQLYGGDRRTQAADLVAESAAPARPWDLPGISTCQANAMTNRAQFFTNHAHTPMLLLAGVPLVSLGGGHTLYVCLLLLSIGAIVAMAAVVVNRLEISWGSRRGLLIVAAVAGWQPVLAGVRQADAVLPAAGLVALAWHLVRRNRRGTTAVAASAAACLALPAIGVLPALVRLSPRTAAVAVMIVLASIAVTIGVAGAGVVPGFLQTVAETSQTYAYAPSNYAVAGRLVTIGVAGAVLVVAFVLLCSWWRAQTVDAAFAAYVPLGLMIAPVVWSQHLALLFVPAAVLVLHLWENGSSGALAVWALLLLLFSLPDSTMARLSELAPTALWGPALPIVPIAVVLLWGWTLYGGAARPSLTTIAAET
jgi:hypothetical protein